MYRTEIENIEGLSEVAAAVIERSKSRKVVAFYGEMGAGKTTLIREICRQKGVQDSVTSPTFAIVNHYRNDSEDIFHFDFYRIDNPAEAFDLGYEEYFESGSLCLVEWPEKIGMLMPEDCLNVRIHPTGDNSRLITIE